MNSRQRRKEAAKAHNEMREQQKALELDKLENPEKYKRKPRKKNTKASLFIAAAAGMGLL